MSTILWAMMTMTSTALAGGDAPELDTPSSAANPQLEIQNLRQPEFVSATLEAWNGLIGEMTYAAPPQSVLKTVFSRLDSNDDGQLKYSELAKHNGKSHTVESWTFSIETKPNKTAILGIQGIGTVPLGQ